MSQVKFTAVIDGREVEVMAGWDRPLQEFFMTIFGPEDDDEENIIWSSVSNWSEVDQSYTTRLRKVLDSFNIEPPKTFWDIVELREGNVYHNL